MKNYLIIIVIIAAIFGCRNEKKSIYLIDDLGIKYKSKQEIIDIYGKQDWDTKFVMDSTNAITMGPHSGLWVFLKNDHDSVVFNEIGYFLPDDMIRIVWLMQIERDGDWIAVDALQWDTIQVEVD